MCMYMYLYLYMHMHMHMYVCMYIYIHINFLCIYKRGYLGYIVGLRIQSRDPFGYLLRACPMNFRAVAEAEDASSFRVYPKSLH